MSINYYTRLEIATRSDDLTPGVAAAVYDAAWLLARQWQLGELIGDDAGTPIRVLHTAEVVRVTQLSAGGATITLDSGATPWEAHVEAAPFRDGRVWSLRMRADAGRELAAQLRERNLDDRLTEIIAAFPFAAPDPSVSPDEPGAGLASVVASRVPDGQAVHDHWAAGLRQRPPVVAARVGVAVNSDLRDALVAWLAFCLEVVIEPAGDAWDAQRFGHTATLTAWGDSTSVELRTEAHGGGPLDWWAFDARGLPPDPAATTERVQSETVPTRVQFRGMPNPRWWEIEDAAIDFGRVDANPADLARMALLEFALVYGNDQFAIPVRLPVGSLCRTSHLLVSDTFGLTVRPAPAAVASATTGRTARGSERWTIFSLNDGQGVSDWFCLPATAAERVTSPPVEEVLFTRDEMANVAWAIERLVWGPTDEPVDRRREDRSPPVLTVPDTDPSVLRWLFGSTVPSFWFPLVNDPNAPLMFEVQRMGVPPGAANVPRGQFISVGARIATDAVPREGRRLRRDFVSIRGADGGTLVWSRRRATAGRGEGSSGLVFDRAEPRAP
jgi:hypothetical protein